MLSITPLKDRPFEDYLIAQATVEVDAFESIVDRAKQRVEDSRDADGATGKTLFLALRELGAKRTLILPASFRRSTSRMCRTRTSAMTSCSSTC